MIRELFLKSYRIFFTFEIPVWTGGECYPTTEDGVWVLALWNLIASAGVVALRKERQLSTNIVARC
jgi:hypothetical protein